MVEDEVAATMKDRVTGDEGLAMEEVAMTTRYDEVEYEGWKVQELKRLKRDRDEAETFVKEQAELDRFRNL